MAESQRRLLARELAEINAGSRVVWSAQAVHRAARIIRDLPFGPADRPRRCREIASAIMDVVPDQLSAAVCQLESLAWLLVFADEPGDADGEQPTWSATRS
jgi:hypothetical protein